jgi:N-acetylmuramic acid 6-phosphate etherase
VLVGISASSVTAYVRGALEAARDRSARTVLLTCAASSPRLDAIADLVIALDTGPEVLTGSTRLKAGSATKAVLNALTTTAMVAVGKVYGNLMVDLRAGSAKLRDRAVRIVATAVGLEHEAAAALLAVAGGEVKVAIVMGRAGVNRSVAIQLLEQARGHVRRALAPQPDASH